MLHCISHICQLLIYGFVLVIISIYKNGTILMKDRKKYLRKRAGEVRGAERNGVKDRAKLPLFPSYTVYQYASPYIYSYMYYELYAIPPP